MNPPPSISALVPDPKQGEREYYRRIGESGRRHTARKPFGDEQCAQYLLHAAVVLTLLPPPPARVVELGCGSGWLSVILAEQGYAVTGVDISPEAIALANAHRDARGVGSVSFQVADYEELRLGPMADCVLFHDALHHSESEEAALRAAYAALAPGGLLICLEPGDGHHASEPSQRAVRQFGVHEKDMPPRKIVALGRRAGFRRHLVLPWPWFFVSSTYRGGYRRAATTADLQGRKLLSLFRLLRSFFRTRAQGVVLLWKN